MEGDWNGKIVLNVSFIIFLFQFNVFNKMSNSWMLSDESIPRTEKVIFCFVSVSLNYYSI